MTRLLGAILCSYAAIGCGSEDGSLGPNERSYGVPTPSTEIHLAEYGGLAAPGPMPSRAIDMFGTTATLHMGDVSAQVEVALEDVAAIIDALEAVDFLDLDEDSLSDCLPQRADAPLRDISVELEGGSNMLRHDTNLIHGKCDELEAMEKVIFDRSGYTAWLRQQLVPAASG
jgi:hypothetical protein